MKKSINYFFLFLNLFTITSCKPQSGENVLSTKEKELVEKLAFDSELMTELKITTSNELKQMPSIDEETGEIADGFYNGICSKIIAENTDATFMVKNLKDKYKEKGYLIFVFTDNEDQCFIGVMKGKEEIDIIKYRRTNGINYDLTDKEVIAKLESWKSKNDFYIYGCGRDWLQLEFKELPQDLGKFAKEVYKFCPDIVDQGVGEFKYLREAIVEMKGVYLWWD